MTAVSVLTVNTTADSGAGSLRQAILNADGSSSTETIQFAIPGSGVHTISPLTPLPAITHSVIINGETQPGYVSSSTALTPPLIDINGASTTGVGLTLASGSSSSTIEGLAINGFSVLRSALPPAPPGTSSRPTTSAPIPRGPHPAAIKPSAS